VKNPKQGRLYLDKEKSKGVKWNQQMTEKFGGMDLVLSTIFIPGAFSQGTGWISESHKMHRILI
jgi:hypothetical protein